MRKSPRRDRVGAAAMEFALVLPILTTALLGSVDYGWYFFREWLIADGLREAMRAGSYQRPATNEASNHCSACLSTTASYAVNTLAEVNITVTSAQVTPTVGAVAGTCALVMDAAIPATPLVGLVPMPATHDVHIVAYAQNLSGC